MNRARRPLNAVSVSHAVLADLLSDGDIAVDATCGNGHDTVFLAERVAPSGHVYAMDIQATAVESTRARVESEGHAEVVTVFHGCHRDVLRNELEPQKGACRLVMFNFGWLPGSDKKIITRTETTIPALEAASDLLAPGGLLSLTLYPGHAGGAEEAAAVLAWLRGQPTGKWLVADFHLWERPTSPQWLAVWRNPAYDAREG